MAAGVMRTPTVSPVPPSVAPGGAAAARGAATPAAAPAKVSALAAHVARVREAPYASRHNDPNPAFRPSDEDASTVGEFTGPDGTKYFFFGVFDGHGGEAASGFVATQLPETIAQLLGEGHSLADAVHDAFYLVDQRLEVEVDHDNAGSTAVLAVIWDSADGKRHLLVAHCGDTRAVMFDGSSASGTVERLTTDHSPETKRERDRIVKAGGYVTAGRVLGVLAVSRAFGNFEMKELVPPEPDIVERSFAPPSDDTSLRFLVVACDGLWDVLSDEEACEVVGLFCTKKSANFSAAARPLVQRAIDKSTTDNVTAVVVYF